MTALDERPLEAFEAERLAFVVDRLDQTIAVKNEAIAGCSRLRTPRGKPYDESASRRRSRAR